MPGTNPHSLNTRLEALSIRPPTTSQPARPASKPSKPHPAVADSWDDDDEDDHSSPSPTSSSSASDTETESTPHPPLKLPKAPGIQQEQQSIPNAPPPTPVSSRPPTSCTTSNANPMFPVHNFPAYTSSYGDFSSATTGFLGPGKGVGGSEPAESTGEVRQEKSTQTAARMIAASLGVRPPKRTEEQKQYDRAVRANEQKKRDREREEKRAAERQREAAIKAVWED